MPFFYGLIAGFAVCGLMYLAFKLLNWWIDLPNKPATRDEPDIGGWIDRLDL